MAGDQELYEVLSTAWEEAMDKKDFHGAIDAGIAAYLALRQKNKALAEGALGLIHVAITQLFPPTEAEPNSCSFCGRSGSETRLGAGPHAFICIGCVELFNEAFGIKGAATPVDQNQIDSPG